MTALTARQLIAVLNDLDDKDLDQPVHLDARTAGSTTADSVVELAHVKPTTSAVVLAGNITIAA